MVMSQSDGIMTVRTEKTWKVTISFQSKLRTYIKYKTLFRTEKYVKNAFARNQWCIFAHSRSRESGGRRNLERVCLTCTEGAVEFP